jgi:hypothetical protein
MNRNIVIIFAVILAAIIGGGVFMITKSQNKTTDQPQAAGKYKWQKFPDLGRTHIKDGTKITYNSNPPTSGPHNATWQKYGTLDKPVADEFLVHSLEHGYIIISYNCAKVSDTQCPALQKAISEILKEKRSWKIIVTPRPGLDVPVALTAWTYLDKMDSFDKARTLAFIDQFRDKGPEQTME